jgi:hypothetical protein
MRLSVLRPVVSSVDEKGEEGGCSQVGGRAVCAMCGWIRKRLVLSES